MSNTIFLVDDHTMMREGIQSWIEKHMDWKITGSCSDISSTLTLLKETSEENHPQIIIIDADLGEESGFDLVKTIGQQYPHIKIIMYSMHLEQGYAMQAKNFGAKAYISKASDSEEFRKCIEAVSKGEDYLEESMTSKNKLLSDFIQYLTPKEKIILQEVLKGFTNEQIAKTLDITVHTVEVYVSKLYDKLGVHSRSELISKFG